MADALCINGQKIFNFAIGGKKVTGMAYNGNIIYSSMKWQPFSQMSFGSAEEV